MALCTYSYLCNRKMCKNCIFPTCSHTTDLRYRLSVEGTEMKLLHSSNDIKYYVEFLKENEDTIDKINQKELNCILKGE